MSVFREGQSVYDRDRKGLGHILAVAGGDGVHVKWASGPYVNTVTLESKFDIEPAIAAARPVEDPMHLVAVRRNYDTGGEDAVLTFLATNDYLQTWSKIAASVLEYTEDLIRRDASMDLVEEQLTTPERENVIQASARALLRDAFTIDE